MKRETSSGSRWASQCESRTVRYGTVCLEQEETVCENEQRFGMGLLAVKALEDQQSYTANAEKNV